MPNVPASRRSRLDWQEAETPEARGRRAVVGELLALRARRIQPLLEDAPGGRGRFARIGAYGLEVRLELSVGRAPGPR